jgi:hypothetical protein
MEISSLRDNRSRHRCRRGGRLASDVLDVIFHDDCSIDNIDLADWLVRNGLALDWPRYSKGEYDAAEREAEHAGREAAMLSLDYFEPAFARAVDRRPAQMMRMLIRE